MAARARLSHLDAAGRARMVDVGDKPVTTRVAVAGASVGCGRRRCDDRDGRAAEGRRARGRASRRHHGREAHGRAHPALSSAAALARRRRSSTPRGARRVDIEASVRSRAGPARRWRRSTAASVAALTIYDMCKAVDRDIEITPSAAPQGGRQERPCVRRARRAA
jgi:cyclic pyranopterin phosphate synthase